MNDQTREDYNFCPKCGTLMENGVCPECSGRHEEQGVYSSQNYPQDNYPQDNHPQGQPQQGNGYPQEPQYDPYGSYQNQQGPYQNQQGPCQNQQNQYYGQQGPCQGQQNAYYNQQNQYYGQQGPYQGQQNSYYGQPNYNPYNNNIYVKPKKDNNVWVVIGVVVAIIFLIGCAVLSFFYGYWAMKFTTENTDWYAGEYDFDDQGSSAGSNSWDGDDGGYDYGEEDDYVPSPDDKYYYGPCDAINENVDYSFVTKSYTNEDPDNNIDVVINYVELKGDGIPNIDQLNEAIEKVALYYAEDFPKYSYYAEYGDSYSVYTTTYVTYNDEDMISIVIDEYVVLDDEYHVDLYPINIDVKNGVVLDNGSLLQIDAEFAREFRRRNDEQNGSVDYLDALSDEELAQVLRDKQSVIAYYTPLGMEVGMNYSDSSTSGWLTVTYKDYEKYLMKF